MPHHIRWKVQRRMRNRWQAVDGLYVDLRSATMQAERVHRRWPTRAVRICAVQNERATLTIRYVNAAT